MNHVQEPPNIIPAELLKSDSLISSSINDYINKLNTLQYLQKNNPNYPIPLPSKHNSQIDIEFSDPNSHGSDYSK